jgi:hypothetical protein
MPIDAVRRHVRSRLQLLAKRNPPMIQLELTVDEMRILQTALNHEIGALTVKVGDLARALRDPNAPDVRERNACAREASALYDKLVEATGRPPRVLRA